MPYVIGTAGHIDHGKTSLVKALTGQDTDRLKEEKERGISIDLGFAHLDLPDGTQAGVVDVPGHERFIKNMLAGAHGMDLVLFTVAADDGVMPQTEEHLDIVHLLGVQRAIFVITKVDVASPARIREVDEEIRLLTSDTSLENSPVIPVSVVTGQGLDELCTGIARVLQSWSKPRPHGYFRLPVDRTFVLQGHGVVVTGTASSGRIGVGERVRCLPGGQLFRVRSLQVHGHARDTATWGQRVALNLSGEERASIERGQVLCHESLTLVSNRFDARLEVRPTAVKGISSHQRVRVHIGTAERLGTVTILGPDAKLGPRQSAYCQIVLTEPVLALRGDRFIVRDETARRTLGGGIVLHPWPGPHKKKDPNLQRVLAALHTGTANEAARTFLETTPVFAASISSVQQFLNLEDDEARQCVEQLDGIRILRIEGERLYTTSAKWQRLQQALVDAIRAFHAAHPLTPGMEMEALRSSLAGELEPKVFRAFVEQLESEKAVAREQSLLRLPTHTVRLQAEEEGVVQRIRELLAREPLAPPVTKHIEEELRIPRGKLADVIRVMERERSIVRIAPDLYFLAEPIEKVRAGLRQHLIERGTISAATFRDLFGTSRKYAIPLLEYFDREGLTVRVGDARRLKSPPAAMGSR
jgi:selenocysteine-specific elongation factor